MARSVVKSSSGFLCVTLVFGERLYPNSSSCVMACWSVFSFSSFSVLALLVLPSLFVWNLVEFDVSSRK